ncbi:MAG: YheC/YheD family protein [Kyrpidia sp.]|nr:YheC/YheD family protein [Kyrpidia sp.]
MEGPLRIESLVHTQPVVFVAAPLLRRYGLRQGSSIAIRAGLGESCTVQIRSHILDRNILLMARPVLHRLGLQRGDRIHAMWGGTQLQLGPVVALWLPVRRETPRAPFGSQTVWARDTLGLAKEMGILAYVLDPRSPSAHVRAWTWSNKAGWVPRTAPAPDALWRRGERLVPPRGPLAPRDGEQPLMLAPDIGDKWTVYKRLIQRGLGAHVPWTQPMTLRRMAAAVNRFGRVYVKPRRGSRGRNLILLERHGDAIRWKRFAPSPKQGLWAGAPSPSEWRTVAGNRAYIIQEALQPLSAGGRPVDFRWLVQRNSDGRWSVTALAARCAPGEDGPTNLSTGGVPCRADGMLDDAERDRGENLALSVAHVTGLSFPGLAELGIDLVFDVNSRWWVLDVNPRPGRLTLKRIDPGLRQLSIRKPFEYVKYATGYTMERIDDGTSRSGV